MTSNSCAGSSPARGTRLGKFASSFFNLPVMFYVYILKSESSNRYYIGYSELPDRRLFEHNSGKVKSTRNFRPWVKVYSETFDTELLAIRREREIKAKKSRIYIELLLKIDTSR